MATNLFNLSAPTSFYATRRWHPFFVYFMLFLLSPTAGSYLATQNASANRQIDEGYSFLKQWALYVTVVFIIGLIFTVFHALGRVSTFMLPFMLIPQVLSLFWLVYNRKKLYAIRRLAQTDKHGVPGNRKIDEYLFVGVYLCGINFAIGMSARWVGIFIYRFFA